MQNLVITEDQTGCALDNHRGHYITRDVIELAVEFGFIIGGFEKFVIDLYDEHNHRDYYPHEELIELCDDAIAWLNSGQGECDVCGGTGEDRSHTPHSGFVGICKACSGSGRGPRHSKWQNFPPRVPAGYVWQFNDGDFGLYNFEKEN